MIIKMMTMSSMLMLYMNNPMSMGLLLLVQTMLMVMLFNKMMMTSWFMMITFLMMIGGLMILVMYMSSISSNEKFYIKLNLILLMLFMAVIMDEMFSECMTNETESLSSLINDDLSMTKMYNMKSMMITMMLVMYLLLTMISVSNIVKHHAGPLRAYSK
nr:NADH dehydrogenase subunit 6 [Shaddai sp. SL-2021a]